MTSKVLVKLPTVPFSQGKKPAPELTTMANRNDQGMMQLRYQGNCGDRTAQLEQNMKFLQEQHQVTLVALHQEVESLRQRNRDLQFQLVFSKGTACAPGSPSSPEENANGFVKPKGSPVSVNVTPLQVELLERDLQDIKTSLNEAKTHNQYLSSVIERQKKRLDVLENQKEKSAVIEVGVQVGGGPDEDQEDLRTRVKDAEALVKVLHRENEDQRRQIVTLKATPAKNNGNGSGGRARGGNNGHHNRGSAGTSVQEQSSPKFPPLPTQSYWHRNTRGNHSFDHSADYHRNGRSRQENQERDLEFDGVVLPQLRNGNVRIDSSNYPPPFHRSRGYHNGGGYYREGGNRKYRGQKSQRDRRESESGEQHRRDFKDPRDSKDQQKDSTDSAHGSRDPKNSRTQ